MNHPRTVHCASKYANAVADVTNRGKCTFVLNRPLTVPPEYEMHVSVLSATIPFSFYSIPSSVAFQFVAGAVWATISPGNWSATDIANLLTVAGTINVTYVWETGLFSFKNNSASAFTLPINNILGTLNTKVVAPGATVVGDIIPDIAGTRFINILSTLNTQCITTGTTSAGSGVLISLPVNCAPNGFIQFAPQNLVRNKLSETYINTFDITICDSNMQPLNLHGCDFELDLLVETVIPIGENPKYNEAPVQDSLFDSVRNYKRK